MKGDMIDIFATLVFIAGVFGTVVFLGANFISTTEGVETPMENFESLQAAYAVESCFLSLGEKDYVTSEFLDSREGDFVGEEDFCNIPYPPIHVEVTDMETGKEWEFDRPLGAALEHFFDKFRGWVKDKKFIFWKKQREISRPKHSIFISIMYESITNLGGDDVIFKNGGKYVIFYSKIHDTGVKGDDLKLDVYPIERYEGELSGLTQTKIENDKNLTDFEDEMGNLPTGSQKSTIIVNVYRDVTVGDIIGKFGLASDPSVCGGSLGKKICITYFGREIHGGKLHVEI